MPNPASSFLWFQSGIIRRTGQVYPDMGVQDHSPLPMPWQSGTSSRSTVCRTSSRMKEPPWIHACGDPAQLEYTQQIHAECYHLSVKLSYNYFNPSFGCKARSKWISLKPIPQQTKQLLKAKIQDFNDFGGQITLSGIRYWRSNQFDRVQGTGI